MRLQVVIGDRRIVVPVKDGLTTKDLLDETRRRTGLSPDAGDTIVTAGGFELYMEDQVADVLNDGETVHVVTPNQLLACMTTGPSALRPAAPQPSADKRVCATRLAAPQGNCAATPPFRILLVRHGLSAANIDPSVYEHTPEHSIELSPEGKTMARNAGQAIKQYLQEVFGEPANAGHIRMWYSPYVRTFQTAQCIRDSCGEWISDARESPMIAELDYGLFEGRGRTFAQELGLAKELKHYNLRASHSGRFWARFPMGESPFDVCQRMQLFFGTIKRDCDGSSARGTPPIKTIIVVTHGIALRAFVKMWCHKSHDWYEGEWNPNNCAVRLITQTSGDEGYIFNGYDTHDPSKPAVSPYAFSMKQTDNAKLAMTRRKSLQQQAGGPLTPRQRKRSSASGSSSSRAHTLADMRDDSEDDMLESHGAPRRLHHKHSAGHAKHANVPTIELMESQSAPACVAEADALVDDSCDGLCPPPILEPPDSDVEYRNDHLGSDSH